MLKWGPLQAASLFTRSTSNKKVIESVRANGETVKQYHALIWPGMSCDSILSKMASKKRTRDNSQEAWLRENTMSTSMYVSFMLMTMNHKFRNVIDRSTACNSFQNLVNLLAASLGGFSLGMVPYGSKNNEENTVHIDSSGFVDASAFWTQEFYYGHVRGPWGKDFTNENKTWVTTKHGLGRVHLAQLICFSLDPQHTAHLRGTLEGEMFNLMSHFARVLDDSVDMIARDIESLGLTGQFRSKKKLRRVVKTMWVERVAKKLWDHEDSCHSKVNQSKETCFVLAGV